MSVSRYFPNLNERITALLVSEDMQQLVHETFVVLAEGLNKSKGISAAAHPAHRERDNAQWRDSIQTLAAEDGYNVSFENVTDFVTVHLTRRLD